MKNLSLQAGQALQQARDALMAPPTGDELLRLVAVIDHAKALFIGESLSWITFRERVHNAIVALSGPSAPVAKREALIQDLRALLDYGRLPDEISAEAHHEEQMAALKAIRRDTALLTAHTVECWVDSDRRGNHPSDRMPRKCAYHPTHKWTNDLCPVHRAYLGLAENERFTPPPWLKQ